ncbi:hypothetical protein ACWIGW_42225 [Nocardia brasiliensis]
MDMADVISTAANPVMPRMRLILEAFLLLIDTPLSVLGAKCAIASPTAMRIHLHLRPDIRQAGGFDNAEPARLRASFFRYQEK